MDIEEGEYLVLEVREQQLFPILNSIGGLEGGEEACHVVSWTLLG
jgi:hypothetical protein